MPAQFGEKLSASGRLRGYQALELTAGIEGLTASDATTASTADPATLGPQPYSPSNTEPAHGDGNTAADIALPRPGPATEPVADIATVSQAVLATASVNGGSGSQSTATATTVSASSPASTEIATAAAIAPAAAPATVVNPTITSAVSADTAAPAFGVIVNSAPTRSYNDGASGAPAGTPELPTLFAGYASRPAWNVAGVDYAVGLPSGTVLKDPTLISMTGVAVDATNHLIRINGNNVTLNGYDFSLHNGWGVYITGGVTGTVIENSNFMPGSNAVLPINALAGAGSLTVEDSTFNGGAIDTSIWALINYNGSGNFVSEYNVFENSSEDAIDFSTGTITPTINYNLFYNLGLDPGSHADAVQYNADVVNNPVEDFNTIYQPTGIGGDTGMQGVQISAQDNSTITNVVVSNNVVVAKGPALTMSYSIAVGGSSPNVLNGVVVSNNYIDDTGAYGPFYPPQGSKLTFTNNINLVTGATFASPSGTSSSDVTAVAASPSSGAESAGNTITFTLTMDQAMTVVGTPTLALNDGGVATYSGGSGTNSLTFSYTVGATDSAVAALAITGVNLPSGASITDSAGNPANLTGAVKTFTGLAIAASTTPAVTAVVAAPSSGTEGVGASITMTLNFNKAVTVTGTPTLTLNDGGVATYSSGSGGTALNFSYTVSATNTNVAALAITAVTLPGGATIRDAGGNSANLAGAVATFSGLQIDTTTPSVTQAVATPTSGTELPGNVVALALDFNKSVTVTGTPTLTLNDGGVATYSSGSGGGVLNFTYTVAATDSTVPALAITGVNLPGGAAIKDAAGNTANLTGAATTFTGLAIDPPAPSGYTDGAANAPAGAAQLPTILGSYATRPAWKVAGVDYAVGVPTGTTLKDPTVAGNLPSGASYNTATNTVTVTGNNVTLSGLDFSLHGGVQLSIQSTNVTVENSNFVLGASEGSITALVRATSSAGNVTFLDNTFNGNDVAVAAQASALLSIQNHGTVTFEYNYFHDTGGDVIDFSGGPQADIVQYNLFENVGVNTAHADTLQWYNSQITSGIIGFNTVYQNVPQPGPGNGALTVLSEGPTATMTNMMVNNDTVIQTAAVSSSGATTGNFTTGFYADLGGTASGVTIHDLYIDPTGAVNYTGMWLLPTGSYGSNLATPTAISGVTNMVTGTTYTTLPKAYSYYVAPSANGVTPTLNDIYSVTASQTSGTINLGGTLTFSVNLDEAFTLSGTPTLKLNDGGVATYVSGSGSNTWAFRYTVAASDTAVSTLAITGVNLPSGASAVDAVGNTANLTGEQVSFAGVAVNPSNGVACFVKGTNILTNKGEIPVELLTIGDMVVTYQGHLSPIKWIGHRGYDASIVHANPHLRPVRIHANALADGLPRRDLCVSPLHAIFIDGILIPAAALVNGVSIDRPEVADICYYHVELAVHDVIFADGAPAESFIDFDSRSLFANAQEYVALYPDELQVQLKPCVPRVEDGWLVDSVWRRLADRAAPMRAQLPPGTLSGHVERIGLNCVEGWVVDTTNPDTPVELEILVAGTRSGRIIANQYRTDLDRAGYSGGRCAFSFIFPPGQVRGDAIVVRRISDRTELPKHRTAECGPAIESRIRKQAA